jgi:hypothetical protein
VSLRTIALAPDARETPLISAASSLVLTVLYVLHFLLVKIINLVIEYSHFLWTKLAFIFDSKIIEIFGFMQTAAIFLTEICNLMKSFDHKKPQDVIVRFVGFELVLSVPKLLHPAMEGFEVPKAVGSLVLTKSRKGALAISTNKKEMASGWVLNLVYCCFKWYFVSICYYFFPFVVIFALLFMITFLYNSEA